MLTGGITCLCPSRYSRQFAVPSLKLVSSLKLLATRDQYKCYASVGNSTGQTKMNPIYLGENNTCFSIRFALEVTVFFSVYFIENIRQGSPKTTTNYFAPPRKAYIRIFAPI
ncbi:hypothetical protein D3C71_681420 [compost metagenome]